ncbi:SUKH-3 domain-containing protein [Amycolatopsis dendrobii]|uniref:SUKH-3 domain-containing protein n=1 Tax=Amycolatopsis dendrobii TaxID=2760662 RepID=A0A7W3VTV3_9PSEU|nr:SUKH-3 domain-containing protein [Amycolatopsis dendrobii]MBB1153083.1 SUKH-3 domain-containing protein [Amycolatopsis dendrobii]
MSERPSIELLRRAGWTPGRAVDISDDVRALERAGIGIFPGAIEFLREYSGIKVRWNRSSGFPDDLEVSAARSRESLDPRWVAIYAERAGTALVPVGEANRGYLVVLVGEDGRWFGGFDDAFGELGDDFLSSLDGLVRHCRFIRDL